MGVYTRILIRYIAGYLVLRGVLPEDIANIIANDPDVAAVVGLAMASATEAAYGIAKRLGWTT